MADEIVNGPVLSLFAGGEEPGVLPGEESSIRRFIATMTEDPLLLQFIFPPHGFWGDLQPCAAIETPLHLGEVDASESML